MGSPNGADLTIRTATPGITPISISRRVIALLPRTDTTVRDSPFARSANVISVFLFILSRLHLPEDIYDHPFAVELSDLHVIDPVPHFQFYRGGSAQHVEDGDVFLLLCCRRMLA